MGLGTLLVLVAGAAAFVVTHKTPSVEQPPMVKPAAMIEAPKPVVEAPAPAEPREVPPPAAPAAELEVIVDSMPPGAKILRDGKPLAETPDTVKVPLGQTLAIVLSKKGFADEPVLVDPAKGRKMLVKLDRAQKNGKKALRALPHLPVYSMPAETPPRAFRRRRCRARALDAGAASAGASAAAARRAAAGGERAAAAPQAQQERSVRARRRQLQEESRRAEPLLA